MDSSITRPGFATHVGIGICAVVIHAAHRNDTQRLCVREIALQSALQFKVIAIYQVLELRISDGPLQLVVAGIGAGLILFLGSLEIVNTVVRRYIHSRTLLNNRITGSIILDIEVSGELLNYRVGSHDKQIAGAFGIAETDDIGTERSSIVLRLIIERIRYAGITVSGYAILVERIQERRKQLRSHERIARIKRTEIPGVAVFLFTGFRPVDTHIHLDRYIPFSEQRCGRIPIELEESDLRTVVVLALDDNELWRPRAVVANVVRSAIRHRGDGGTTQTMLEAEIGSTFIGIFLILVVAVGLHIGDERLVAILDIEDTCSAIEVVVVGASIRPDWHFEMDMVGTGRINHIMFLPFEIIISVHLLSDHTGQPDQYNGQQSAAGEIKILHIS